MHCAVTAVSSCAPARRSGGGDAATPEPLGGVAEEDSFEANLDEVKRSSSTLARLTRSVGRLGSKGRQQRKAEKAEKKAASARAAPPPPSTSRGSVSAADRATPAGVPRPAKSGGLQDFAATTAARIKLFEEGRFDVEGDIGALTEKGVESLRADLSALDAEVAEHLKRAVQEQCADFVRATPGLLKLEGEVQALRALLHGMTSLMGSLEGVAAAVAAAQEAVAAGAGGAPPAGGEAAGGEAAWRASSEGATWHDYLDQADMALVERHAPEALALLRKLEKLLLRLQAAAAPGDAVARERLDALAAALAVRRAALAPLIRAQLLSPLAFSADVRRGAELLAAAAGRPAAHRAALQAFAQRLRAAEEALLTPANAGGGDPEGCEYATALGQKLVQTVGAALADLGQVFGAAGGDGDGDALAAARVVWALAQAERAAELLRKHALAPFAGPAGLGATCRCVHTFLAFAAALEDPGGVGHGPPQAAGAQPLVPLQAALLAELAPVVEGVLAKRVRRLGEQLRKAVVVEVERLVGSGGALGDEGSGGVLAGLDLASWDSLAQALPSADFLLDEVDAIARDLSRLPPHYRLWAAATRAVAELYATYTVALGAALGRALRYGKGEGGATAAAAAAEAAMEVCTLLAERLLAEAAAPLAEAWGGEACDAGQLSEHLVRLGEGLGMTVAPLPPAPGGVDASVAVDATGGARDSEEELAAAAAGEGGAAGARQASQRQQQQDEDDISMMDEESSQRVGRSSSFDLT
eukprot:scaffold7.g3391.t1